MPALTQEKLYTIDDIYALPDGERAELIDGQIYYMAPPSRKHQRILGEIYATIREYIKENNGSCEVDIAPFAVFLNKDDTNHNSIISIKPHLPSVIPHKSSPHHTPVQNVLPPGIYARCALTLPLTHLL